MATKNLAIKYPADAGEEIGLLVSMAMGRIKPDIELAAYCGWCVWGYCQGLLLDEPEAQAEALTTSTGHAIKYNESDLLEALISLQSEDNSVRLLARLGGQARAQSIGSGLGRGVLVRLILPQLLKYVKDWVNGGGLEDFINKIISQNSATLSVAMDNLSRRPQPHATLPTPISEDQLKAMAAPAAESTPAAPDPEPLTAARVQRDTGHTGTRSDK